MNTRVQTIFTTLSLILLLAPVRVFGQEGGLVPCGGANQQPCNFGMLLKLVERLIDFAIIISPMLAALAFMWAGFLYVTAAGNSGKISSAHQIFWNTLIGLVLILAAWLIVNAILVGLGVDDAFILVK